MWLFTNLYAQYALEGDCQTNYAWWFANQMMWMTSDVFESWMMSRNVQFKFQKRKVLLIMDELLLTPLSMLVGVDHLVFNLQLSNIIIVFLPRNVTSVLQPLDQGISASSKVQFKKKLLQWVLSWFVSTTTHDH